MSDELSLRSIAQLAPLIESKQISPVELFDETLKRIHKLQPKLNSFITITEAEVAILRVEVALQSAGHGGRRRSGWNPSGGCVRQGMVPGTERTPAPADPGRNLSFPGVVHFLG